MQDETQDSGMENNPDEVMDTLGVGDDDHKSEPVQPAEDDLPGHIKQRLARQEKKHAKELAAIRREMAERMNPIPSHGQPTAPSESYQTDHQIQLRNEVHKVLHEEREREKQRHVEEQYQKMHQDLGAAGHKYEDFEDVVMGDDVPFTSAIRDAALLIPADMRADVLYKLGKNKDELKRILKLQPLEQAQEVIKLSHGLMGGDRSSSHGSKPLNPMKGNPSVNNSARGVNEKTSVSELRNRMKSGWK
jgi:hypothetical protein